MGHCLGLPFKQFITALLKRPCCLQLNKLLILRYYYSWELRLNSDSCNGSIQYGKRLPLPARLSTSKLVQDIVVLKVPWTWFLELGLMQRM